ncbi:MAG: DUF4352 domain-containing protein [Eubacterium sp.]
MVNEINNNSTEVQQAVDAAMLAQKKKKKKKLIIISVIAIAVIAVAALSAGSGDSENKVENINDSSISQSADENNKSDKTTAQDTQKIKPGTAVTTNNLKISYLSCDTNWKKYENYAAPDSGNKIIRAEFTFENISSSDQSLSGVTCYADNKKCESYYMADDYVSPVLETISAGRSITGIVYFEVPENSKDIELEFESDFWSSEKLIFAVE